MTTHFLDTNLFIEINIEKGDYGEYCDILFEKKCNKTTNERILIEIDDIKEAFDKSFDKLITFYRKNLKMDHFISQRQISEKEMDRLKNIDALINQTHGGKAKIQRLEFLKGYFLKTVHYRKQCLNTKTIPSSNDHLLYGSINSVMTDPDDAWHITDAFSWCCINGSTLIWSMDRGVVDPRDAILNAICSHRGINRTDCNLDITHIENVIIYKF